MVPAHFSSCQLFERAALPIVLGPQFFVLSTDAVPLCLRGAPFGFLPLFFHVVLSCSSLRALVLAWQACSCLHHGLHSRWRAVDGNRDAQVTLGDPVGSCFVSLLHVNPWWSVDLGAALSVLRVILTNRDDGLCNVSSPSTSQAARVAVVFY